MIVAPRKKYVRRFSELIAETPPGRCMFCEAPLPPRKRNARQRVICGSLECRRTYHQLYSEQCRPRTRTPRCGECDAWVTVPHKLACSKRKLCVAAGCTNKVLNLGSGLCSAHYQRRWRKANPDKRYR